MGSILQLLRPNKSKLNYLTQNMLASTQQINFLHFQELSGYSEVSQS